LDRSWGPWKLIDSSFFRVYTDPSKPPVIGDLDISRWARPGPVVMTLRPREAPDISGRLPLLVCCLIYSQPLTGTQQVQRPPEDVMGLFPLAGTISSMHPLRISAARSRWPEVLWRRYSSHIQECCSSNLPLRLTISRPSPSPRATTDSADRASESIRRTALERRRSRTASALHRWMLPTVERGPPVPNSV
jgi:hypothetical protein